MKNDLLTEYLKKNEELRKELEEMKTGLAHASNTVQKAALNLALICKELKEYEHPTK